MPLKKEYLEKSEKEIIEQAQNFISFMPGVTEILFYYVLLPIVKPYLMSQKIYPNFMLAVIGPSGHLKTTLVRLYALWLQQEELQEILFYDIDRASKLENRIKDLHGINLIIDDMHEVSTNYRKHKQVDVLDYLTRHCDSKKYIANIIVTGEMIPANTIFSSRDRMFQIRIPKKKSEELNELKSKIRKLPENFMVQLSDEFFYNLKENEINVKEDICHFYDDYNVPREFDGTTRLTAHMKCLQIVEFLYRKYFCNGNETASMRKQFEEALQKQAVRYNKELNEQMRKEEQIDYVEVVYCMLSSKNVYLHMEEIYDRYEPTGKNFSLHNGKFYITRTALQFGLLKYLNRTVSMKKVSDALHDAGVIEEDYNTRTKKFHNVRHYVISRQAIELYCRIKESQEI